MSTIPKIADQEATRTPAIASTIDAQSPHDIGRLRVLLRQLLPVLRHRHHPHGAERGNHRDIHDDPHGPILGSHKERIAAPCQELQEGSEILRLWLSGNETAAGSCKGVGITFGTRTAMERYGCARIRDQGATMIIIRAVFSLAVLALAGALMVALSGHLWGRYQEETAALGFSGVSARLAAAVRSRS